MVLDNSWRGVSHHAIIFWNSSSKYELISLRWFSKVLGDPARYVHFICFVALIIARLLELRLGNKYTISKIVESLNKASGSFLEENRYAFEHADEITKAIAEMLGVDLSRKYLRLGDIEEILGATKKPDSATTFCNSKMPPNPYYTGLRLHLLLSLLQKLRYMCYRTYIPTIQAYAARCVPRSPPGSTPYIPITKVWGFTAHMVTGNELTPKSPGNFAGTFTGGMCEQVRRGVSFTVAIGQW